MQQQTTTFKVKVGEMECVFHFDSACSVAAAKEAIFQCLKWIGKVEDQAEAQKQVDNQCEVLDEQPANGPIDSV